MSEKRNTGRKPIPSHQKKTHVQFYIEQYKIDALGGKEKLEYRLKEFVDRLYADKY